MPIVETKTVTRPNTSVDFFNESNDPVRLTIKTQLQPLVDAGKYTLTKNVSGDGLTQTNVATFDSLDTYSQVDTILGVELDYAYFNYSELHLFDHPSSQYSQTGIDAMFTCTTTYTFSPEVLSSNTKLQSFFYYLETTPKLISCVNTGTQVIAVHQYNNSVDFTSQHWKDFGFAELLHDCAVTRTLSYAMS
jgi:hypothetical protein